MWNIENSVLLITGGTGSFGNAMVKTALKNGVKEVRIFSRDEKKQDEMRREYQSPSLKFYIGDVRDKDSVESAMAGVDLVFSAAALKQVPSCEFFPMEAIKTNTEGTFNVLNAAAKMGVKNVVCLSTDKAVYPINAMGMSKALMEKVMVAASRNNDRTIMCATRYGNVMCSRGSVIPLFMEQIHAGEPLTITDPSMTRFLMSLENSVELVLYAFKNGRPGDIFVQKAPASTVRDLAKALLELFEASNVIEIIGTRHGEKKYESLLTKEEMVLAQDYGEYYRIPADVRDLNYSMYLEQGRIVEAVPDYNSNNTTRLNVEQVKQLLLTLPEVVDSIGRYKNRKKVS